MAGLHYHSVHLLSRVDDGIARKTAKAKGSVAGIYKSAAVITTVLPQQFDFVQRDAQTIFTVIGHRLRCRLDSHSIVYHSAFSNHSFASTTQDWTINHIFVIENLQLFVVLKPKLCTPLSFSKFKTLNNSKTLYYYLL